jgi:transposase
MAYSEDFLDKIVEARKEDGDSIRKLAKRFRVSINTVKGALKRDKELGSTAHVPYRHGPAPIFDEAGEAWLRQKLEAQPDLTEEELAQVYHAERGKEIHRSTVGYALREMGYTRKKRPSALTSKNARM